MSEESTHLLTNIKDAVKSLIKLRNNTLSLYQQLMSFQPFTETPELREILEDFCEQLVDYSGKVHFTLLSNIEQNFSQQDDILQLAEELSQRLVENTQCLLDFQDEYNNDVEKTDIAHLTDKLGKVGECIANRITYEDKLMNAILK